MIECKLHGLSNIFLWSHNLTCNYTSHFNGNSPWAKWFLANVSSQHKLAFFLQFACASFAHSNFFLWFFHEAQWIDEWLAMRRWVKYQCHIFSVNCYWLSNWYLYSIFHFNCAPHFKQGTWLFLVIVVYMILLDIFNFSAPSRSVTAIRTISFRLHLADVYVECNFVRVNETLIASTHCQLRLCKYYRFDVIWSRVGLCLFPMSNLRFILFGESHLSRKYCAPLN